MRIQVRDGNPLYIGNEDFQRVDNYSYLGSMVSVIISSSVQPGRTEEDIIAHIRKDQQAFACLSAVWKATSLSLKTKIRVFNYNVNGSEPWRLTNICQQICVHLSTKASARYFWTNVITNEELWARSGQEDVAITIKRRKWKWSAYLKKGEHH